MRRHDCRRRCGHCLRHRLWCFCRCSTSSKTPWQVCDVLCCFVLLLIYWKLTKDIAILEERADCENVTPADYAVEVHGLPEDAQDEVRRSVGVKYRLSIREDVPSLRLA